MDFELFENPSFSVYLKKGGGGIPCDELRGKTLTLVISLHTTNNLFILTQVLKKKIILKIAFNKSCENEQYLHYFKVLM